MSSANFPGSGGEKRGEEKLSTEPLPSLGTPTLSGSHGHILPQQPIMDMKTLQTIRPKINQSGGVGPHPTPALSAIMPPGLVTGQSDGGHIHVTTTKSSAITAASPGTLPVSMTMAQPNIVHLNNPAAVPVSQPHGSALPFNVIRNAITPRPQFTSHLPRGAIAAASALAKTGPNIATAAPSAVRPSMQIPVSSSAMHGMGAISTIQNPLGRAPILSAIKQGTPPSARSPSPAITIPTSQPPLVDVQHRTPFPVHGQPITTAQSIQITLTTTRSTAGIEIPKPLGTYTQQKPLNIPVPLVKPPSKVIMSQTVNPLLSSPQALAESVNLSLASHSSSVNATPSNVGTTTTVTSTSAIPVAKVTPQRQQPALTMSSSVPQPIMAQDLSRPESSSLSLSSSSHPHPHSQAAGSIYIPQPHRTVSTTAQLPTTPISIATNAPHQESRLDGHLVPQLSHYLPQQDALWQNYQVPYQHLVYQHVAAQAGPTSQNQLGAATPIATPGAVRPGVGLFIPRPAVDQSVPGQNPNLAATLQAHPMSMASAGTVRFANSMMVQVDPRHPMSAVHSQFAVSTASSVNSGTQLSQQDSKPIISSSANLCRTPPPACHDGHGVNMSSASSIYSSSPQSQPPASTAMNNPSASPRPSILRKRTSDGGGIIGKRPMALMPDSHSPRPDPSQPQSNTSSPKTPAGDNNSQSSTDTALSSNDATTPTQNSMLDVKIKQELDALENGPSSLNSLASSPMGNSVEASPRKKPRKQLLNATEELKDNTSTDEDVEKVPSFKESKSKEIKKEPRDFMECLTEYVDDDGVRWTTEKKRPNVNLLNCYSISWKPKNNHFLKFTDVKPKDERCPTVNELSNQRGIHQRTSGWKLYHMAAQLENLNDLEKEMCSRISQLQNALSPQTQAKQALAEDYDGILHELSQANIQRCQLIGDQLDEARGSMLKILEHKPRIQEIIGKHMSKRPIKKKERT